MAIGYQSVYKDSILGRLLVNLGAKKIIQSMIRIARHSDAAQIAAIYAPYIVNSTVSFEMEPPDAVEICARMDKILPQTPWLVYEATDGRVAAYAYASAHRDRLAYQWTREVSVYVHPDFRRQKIANLLYSTLIDILKIQGYTNVLAGITLPNEPSIAFHEAMGFKLLGIYHRIGYKLGAYRDVGWWELFIGSADEAPTVPIPFSQIAAAYPK